jgi:hypothetical protein
MSKRSARHTLLPVLGMALSLLAACTTPADSMTGTPLPLPSPSLGLPTPELVGLWGGKGISVTVGATGATVEFDCGRGSLDAPLALDGSGNFAIAGTYVAEGGATMQDPPPPRPARYAGAIAGQTMTLTVTLTDDNQEIGTYTLGLAQPAEIRKCQ